MWRHLLLFLLLLPITSAYTVTTPTDTVPVGEASLQPVLQGTPFNGTVTVDSSEDYVIFQQTAFAVATTNFTSDQFQIPLNITTFNTGEVTLTATGSNGTVLGQPQFDITIYDPERPPVILNTTTTLDTTDVKVTVQTNEPSFCKHDYSQKPYDQLQYAYYERSNNRTQHSFTVQDVTPDTYTLHTLCKNEDTGVVMDEHTEVTFSYDTKPPSVLSHTPIRIDTEEPFELTVQTDEPTQCRYDYNDASYSDLEYAFDYTFLEEHTADIELATNTVDIFIRCEDENGNVMQESYLAKYDSFNGPKAEIDIDGYGSEDVITDGYYDIELETSTELREPPRLTFKFADKGGSIDVPLTRDGQREYEGTLYIADSNYQGVGFFEFSGIDVQNREGTEITEGRTVQIASKKPDVVEKVTAEATEDDTILIEWEYKEEDLFENYILYKYEDTVDKPKTTFATDEKEYEDDFVRTNTTYYYTVAVVNEALVESPESEPLNVTIYPPNTVEPEEDDSDTTKTTPGFRIPPYLESLLANEREKINETVQTLKAKEVAFEERTYPRLVRQNEQAVQELETVAEMNTPVFESKENVSSYVTKLKNARKEALNNFVVSVDVLAEETTTRTVPDYEKDVITRQYLDLKRWAGEDKEAVLQRLKAFSDNIQVNQTVTTLRTHFESGITDSYVQVRKEVAPSDIPTTIIEYLSEELKDQIVFSDSSVSKRDAYALKKDAESLVYTVPEESNTEKIGLTHTMVFPSDVLNSSVVKPSAFTSFIQSPPSFLSSSAIFYILVLLGTVIFTILAFYDDILVWVEDRRPFSKCKLFLSNSGKIPLLDTHIASRSYEIDKKQVCPQHKAFTLATGEQIRSLEQLRDILRDIPLDVYGRHMQGDKNDFSMWIEDTFQMPELAREIRYIYNKNLVAQKIDEHITK